MMTSELWKMPGAVLPEVRFVAECDNCHARAPSSAVSVGHAQRRAERRGWKIVDMPVFHVLCPACGKTAATKSEIIRPAQVPTA